MGLITARELARRLGIAPNTVYQMAREDRIPKVRIGKGRHLRFDLEEVRGTLGTSQIGVNHLTQTREKTSIGEGMEREIEEAWNRLENGLFESDNPLAFAANHDSIYDEG